MGFFDSINVFKKKDDFAFDSLNKEPLPPTPENNALERQNTSLDTVGNDPLPTTPAIPVIAPSQGQFKQPEESNINQIITYNKKDFVKFKQVKIIVP